MAATLSFSVTPDVKEGLAALDKIEKGIDRVEKAGDELTASTKKLTAATKEEARAVDAAAKATDRETEAKRESTREIARNAKGRFTSTRETDKNTEAQEKNTRATRAYRGEAGLLARGLNSLKSEAADLTKTFVAGLGIAGAIRGLQTASRLSREFGSEIAKVSTALTDTSGLDRYADGLKRLAGEYGLAASAQAASLYEIISAGQDVETAMLTLDAANRLAVGGLTNVETAADGLTSVLNAYRGKVRDAAQVSDILFTAAAAGKTNIEQLSSTLGQVAPIASTVGVGFDQLAASIATLTLSGVSTNVAVTQMRATLNALIKPSKEAEELAKSLGLEFNTTALRAKGLAGFLEDVREKTGGSERAIATLFGSVEAVAGVLTLTGTQAAKFGEVLEQTANSAGATEAAYNKMANTADQAFKRAGVAAQNALITVGDSLNNILVPAAQAFADHIDGIAATIGIVTKVGGAYLTLFVALPAVYDAATVAAWRFVAAQQTAQTGMLTGAASMGALRVAGASLLAAFAGWEIGSSLRDQFVEVRVFGIAMIEGLMVLWERMKFGASVAWEVIKFQAIAAFDVIRMAVAKMIDTFASAVEAIDFTGLYEGAIAGARNVADSIEPATNALTDMADAISANKTALDEKIASIRATTGEMAEYEFAAEAAKTATTGLTTATTKAAAGAADATDELDKLGKEAKSTQPVINQLNTMLRTQARALGNEYADAALDYADALDAINAAEAELRKSGDLGATQIEALTQARVGALEILKQTTAELDKAAQSDAAKKIADDAKELNDILDRTANMGFAPLIHEIELVGDAIKDAMNQGKDVTLLKQAMGGLKHEMTVNMVGAAQQVLGSIQSMTKEGSKAYKAMEVASHALNVVMAISAILNQGKGDPYSAFARMAAMAAAVAGLVGSIGGFGGGGPSTAESRQEIQGTGTVLGDETVKSESILRATEITADATSQLVGINQGMLRALVNLQNSISSAGGMLARGAGEAEYGPLPGTIDFTNASTMLGALGGGILGGILGSIGGRILNALLGGSSRVTDEGIRIGGGGVENVGAMAYQETQTRRWRFGRLRTSEQTAALPDAAADQFQLIMDSIVDTVEQAALALGLLPADIQAAIDAFQVQETHISLMGLSAEEQQAELEAVFSSIFDGLAGSVVPFIEQFQQVGEGLGETLVRVATGVQVTQEALTRLGFAMDVTDPERFAQISEGLIGMAGGLDAFISGMSSFMDNFAPEAHKFEILQSDLTRALEQVGLEVPETRDGMWELMQSLDATTESGQEQIAALLRLSDVADAYYTHLERSAEEAAEAVADFTIRTAEFTQSLADAVFEQEASEFQRAMMNIRRGAAQYISDANALARARGQESASVRDLALIHRWAANEVKKAIAQLEGSIRGLVDQLGYGEAQRIAAQIAAMEAAQQNSSQAQVDGINSVGDASENLFQQWEDGIRNLNDYLDSLLIGSLSPLSPEEQFAEITRQLNEAISGAQAGDIDALNSLPQLADAYLQMLREREASGMDYSGPAQALIDQLRALGVNPFSPPGSQGSGVPGAVALVPSEELLALYARRDELAASQEAAQRLALATELAAYLGELSRQTGETVFAAATRLGVDFAQFITDLGGTVAATTAEQVATLGDVANVLGVELPELADALDLALGELADTQSLLNDAFELQLAELPTEFRDQLEPLLRDLEEASSQEEQNAALEAINDATLDLPEELRLLLAPYLSTVDPLTPDLASELDYLSSLWEEQVIANELLEEIRNELIIARGGTVPDGGAAPAGATANVNGKAAGGSREVESSQGSIVVELQQLRATVEKVAANQLANDTANTLAVTGAVAAGANQVSGAVGNIRISPAGVTYYGN